MRDDFEITTDHIDLIADTAVVAGALGARMTGGGFGGCVIALAPSQRPTTSPTLFMKPSPTQATTRRRSPAPGQARVPH
jgi:mevalonate kinase